MSWNCPECGKSVEIPKMRGPHLSGCRRSKNANYTDIDDFASMCKPCHALYDAARRRAAKAAA